MSYKVRVGWWIYKLGSCGKVLEIGCGNGWMLAGLRDHGWEVVGLERSLESGRFAVAKLNLPIIVGDLEALRPIPTFDLVVLHNVLEHLPDPMRALETCAAVLKPGGSLLIVVQNIASWQFHLTKEHWFHLDVPRLPSVHSIFQRNRRRALQRLQALR